MLRFAFAYSLLVLFAASTDAGDLGPILGPGQPGELPLVRSRVILDGIENAYAVYPVFGQFPGSPGKDLFLGFRVAAKKDNRGRLRVFPNRGATVEPRYGDGFWLDDKVPTARIPTG